MTSTWMSNSRTWPVYSCFFLSGACSLVYETIWLRQLKLVFGNTTIAACVTIAIFMGGLGLGALLVRSRVDRIREGLAAYAGVEALIGAWALATPPLFSGIDRVFVFVFRAFAPDPTALFALQIVLSALVLVIPTCLMGTALPLLSMGFSDRSETIAKRGGLLYAFNTMGALFGAFAAGFLFIEAFGVTGTLRLAAATNLLLGATAYALSRTPRSHRIAPVAQAAKLEPATSSTVDREDRVTLFWFFITGFVAMGYEVVWIRTSIPYLKATTFTFSAILCAYLLGYSLGTFGGSLWVRRARNLRSSVVWLMQAIGCFGVLYMAQLVGTSRLLTTEFGDLNNHLLFELDRYYTVLYALLLFFWPSFLMGASFPILMQMRGIRRDSGRTVATAYSLNTLGCVCGPILTGLWLIPWLGSRWTIELLGLTSIAAIWATFSRFTARQLRLNLLVLASAVAAALMIPEEAYRAWLNRIEGKEEQTNLVAVLEGISTTASVHYYVKDNFTVITTAGINVAGDAIGLRQTQKAQGHIPVILHGKPESVLTVGFGSGELTRLLTLHGVADITCVELSPEMVTLSKRYFSHINLGKNLEEHVKMIYMDARNYIHLTDKRYDLVLNDAIWPGLFAENSSLYTAEYFKDGKRILKDDGIYSTWLPMSLSEESLKSIERTFSDVFQNAILVYPHYSPSPHILLIGQKTAHPYSWQAMQAEFDRPGVLESLKMIGIESAEDVLDDIFTGAESIRAWSGNAPINSDDHPVVEFDHNLYRAGFNPFLHWENLYQMMLVAHPPNLESLVSFPDAAVREGVVERLETRQRADGYLLMSFMYSGRERKLQAIHDGLEIDPTNVDLLHEREELDRVR